MCGKRRHARVPFAALRDYFQRCSKTQDFGPKESSSTPLARPGAGNIIAFPSTREHWTICCFPRVNSISVPLPASLPALPGVTRYAGNQMNFCSSRFPKREACSAQFRKLLGRRKI
jgi:hypothetical protein